MDLAGSERLNYSLSEGERMTEAQHINESLSALGTLTTSCQGITDLGDC